MSKVRQLSECFLRGSLANVTMKNLTVEQQERIDELMVTIGENEVLAGHRQEFLHVLASTIAADYHDSINAAQEEFQIAVWRGIVHLLYHTDYSFKCSICNATSFLSKNNRPIQFNRQYFYCPVCNSCLISDPRDSDFSIDDSLSQKEHLEVIERLQSAGRRPPLIKSSITAINGSKKVEDPEKILNDPDQLKKYFGSFIWNYFRQILLENPITKHQKKIIDIYGPADKTAADAINNILTDMKVFHIYSGYPEQSEQLDGSYYIITCDPMLMPPSELYPRLWEIKEKFVSLGGNIVINSNCIAIENMQGRSVYTSFQASTSAEVQITSTTGYRDSDGTQVDIISQVKDTHMYENDPSRMESNEVFLRVQDCLPDGNVRAVFQLLSGTGPIYQKFVAEYPDTPQVNQGIPHKNRIAKFLRCSQKDIKECEQIIGMQLIAHGVVDVST